MFLAPRERWDANVSEIQAPGWLSQNPRPILWIGGRQNRRGVTWVSSFSLDLIEALEMERRVEVIPIICGGSEQALPLSPPIVFKYLIIQLLKAYPDIVLLPNNLARLSLQRFQTVGESPEAAYRILADVLQMVDQQSQRDGKETFLLLDRIDVVFEKLKFQERQRFLNALWQLNKEYKTLRILVTSQSPADEIEVGTVLRGALTQIWVDTSRPSAMHSR